jgi:hypothetical protein
LLEREAVVDEQFWAALMPVIGPLPVEQRAAAVAFVLQAIRGRYVDAAMIDRLAGELRAVSRPRLPGNAKPTSMH